MVSWHGISDKMFLGDGTLLEGKKKNVRTPCRCSSALPNQVLSMADERGERVGKENIREVQIR